MARRVALYARVSTRDQHPDAQLGRLRTWAEQAELGAVEFIDNGHIARNGTGTAVNIYQAVIRQQSEAHHSVTAMTPPSRNDSVISDGMTVSYRANDSVTAMTLKPPKEPPNRTGRTFVRKTVSKDGEREERWSRALDDLVDRKSYPSHLTGDQLLPVAGELSISTVGVDERQMRSAIEDRLGRLRAGESLEALAQKKGSSGNGSAMGSMTRVILRKLTQNFGDDAKQLSDDLYDLYGRGNVEATAILFEHKPDDEFYDLLTEKLAVNETEVTT